MSRKDVSAIEFNALPVDVLFLIYRFAGIEGKAVAKTSRHQYSTYWAFRLSEEFKTSLKNDVPLFLNHQIYWGKRCEKEFNIQPDLTVNTFFLYHSIDFLERPSADDNERSTDTYQKHCQLSADTLNAHPINPWVQFYLAMLHLDMGWEQSNKTQGVELCQSAMNAGVAKACLLWGTTFKEGAESTKGFTILEALEAQGSLEALVHLITYGIYSLFNIPPQQTLARHTKLRDTGDYRFDHVIGSMLVCGTEPFQKDTALGNQYLQSTPSAKHPAP